MTHKYDPDYAVHPGETLKECMAMYRMTPRAIVSSYGFRAGVEERKMAGEITEIALGLGSVEQRHAEVFCSEFDMSIAFWLDRQAKYDERVKVKSPGAELKDLLAEAGVKKRPEIRCAYCEYARYSRKMQNDEAKAKSATAWTKVGKPEFDEKVAAGPFPYVDVDVPTPPAAPPKKAETSGPAVSFNHPVSNEVRDSINEVIEESEGTRLSELAMIVQAAIQLEKAMYADGSVAGELFRLRKALECVFGQELPAVKDWSDGDLPTSPSTEPIKPSVVMVDWLLGKGWDLQKDKDLGYYQWRSPGDVSGLGYKVLTMDVFPQPVIDFIRENFSDGTMGAAQFRIDLREKVASAFADSVEKEVAGPSEQQEAAERPHHVQCRCETPKGDTLVATHASTVSVEFIKELMGSGGSLHYEPDDGTIKCIVGSYPDPFITPGDSVRFIWAEIPKRTRDYIRRMSPRVDIPVESTIDQMEILTQNGWDLSYREESASFVWRLINPNMGNGPVGESFAGLDHHTVRLSEFPPEVDRYLREHARKRKDNA